MQEGDARHARRQARHRTRAASKPESGLRRTLRCVRPHLRGHRLRMTIGFVALAADVLLRLLEPWPVKIVIDSVSHSLGATISAGPAQRGCQRGDVAALRRCDCGHQPDPAGRGQLLVRDFVCPGRVRGSPPTSGPGPSAICRACRCATTAATSTGDTVQRLVADVSRLQEVAVTAGLPLLGNVVSLVAMMIIMLWLDPLIALVTFLSIGIFVLLSRQEFRIDYHRGPQVTQGRKRPGHHRRPDPRRNARGPGLRTRGHHQLGLPQEQPGGPWHRRGHAAAGRQPERRTDVLTDSRPRSSWPPADGG